MSFIAEVLRLQGKIGDYEVLNARLDRIHERPAWKAAIEKGGRYTIGA